MATVNLKTVFTLTGSILLLQACASTEELFAEYDSQFCVAQTRLGETGIIPRSMDMNWEPVVYFETDLSALTDEHKKKLESNARLIKQIKNHKISLKGFADYRGTEEYNLELAGRRVEEVKAYLIEKLGVDADLIDSKAYGEEKRRDPNSTRPHDSARRVDIVLIHPQSEFTGQSTPISLLDQ